MKKVVVIYWSGTGNTEEMAKAVAAGAGLDGVTVQLTSVDKASIEDVLSANAVALGCPSMGDEVLEESEMEPFVQSLEGQSLSGIPLALFGSYDWGDGQWMRDWMERMKKLGVVLVDDGLTVQSTPDDAGLAKCKELGAKLTSALA
ncbi:Flavodoxin [uncultured Sporomusa sp.]|uniref:Flavodoxin n=1 Tax=uncultured Sporomusa sp. TaxID=307249 RepID=A0A212LY17_9FIRM|nr:flavodoxin [uncultured Sporomusa sp.]SCM82428.1 Flavodoxin [uncultured Sporomusa sp.]